MRDAKIDTEQIPAQRSKMRRLPLWNYLDATDTSWHVYPSQAHRDVPIPQLGLVFQVELKIGSDAAPNSVLCVNSATSG
jgi:hypothetical protein